MLIIEPSRATALFILPLLLVFGGIGHIQTQNTETSAAAPESMPPEIAKMLGEMEQAGADIAVAPSEEPQDIADATTAGNRYVYTTLRVVTKGNPRGCGYAGWNCMTRLCRSDLRDNAAWRGWAGCWKKDSWICYFECGQRRNGF